MLHPVGTTDARPPSGPAPAGRRRDYEHLLGELDAALALVEIIVAAMADEGDRHDQRTVATLDWALRHVRRHVNRLDEYAAALPG